MSEFSIEVRYVGFTAEEIEALLAWLPRYKDDEPANTWERNIASIRRKLENSRTR